MPESTVDRPTTAHEFVFLLTKAERYFYDAFAVQRRGTSGPSDLRKMEESLERIGGKQKSLDDPLSKASALTNIGNKRAVGSFMRQWRTMDLWLDSLRAILDGDEGLVSDEQGNPLALAVNTKPFAGAHFAVFPASLVVPMILAGTSERGACAQCGAPRERVLRQERKGYLADGDRSAAEVRGVSPSSVLRGNGRDAWTETVTFGWRPSCRCGVEETVPCVVLDPFCGSGTAVLVAKELGRVGIGVELKPEYLAMATKRTQQGVLL